MQYVVEQVLNAMVLVALGLLGFAILGTGVYLTVAAICSYFDYRTKEKAPPHL